MRLCASRMITLTVRVKQSTESTYEQCIHNFGTSRAGASRDCSHGDHGARFADCDAGRVNGMGRLVSKLQDLAPYAALELVMPGGSIMALLLWLYRRQKNGGDCAKTEDQ
jgi:hypothetical protein